MAEASVTHYAAATASAVYGRHPPSLDVQGVPILVPRDEASSGVDRTFLAHLTQSAASVASSLACGSVLAGTTSETDEYGDVAFWLGEGEFGLGREHDIFDALGLKSRITQESKFRHVELSPSTHLPISLPTAPGGVVADLTKALSRLDSLHCFRVQGVAVDNSAVLYVLLGRLTASDGSAPWAGLMGIGVWSW